MLRLLICLWVLLPSSALAQKQVTLQASDGLTVSADIYTASTAADATWIVLAHQAGASRGEYRTIAPRLNKLGYNAIALYQRSGRAFAGVTNKTAALAKSKKKSRSYLAARPDIEAGIAWARQQTSGAVILWGSSYSAALALLMSGESLTLLTESFRMRWVNTSVVNQSAKSL